MVFTPVDRWYQSWQEVRSLLTSLIVVLAITVVLLIMSIFVWIVLEVHWNKQAKLEPAKDATTELVEDEEGGEIGLMMEEPFAAPLTKPLTKPQIYGQPSTKPQIYGQPSTKPQIYGQPS
eukprot:Filipodium_phascolosomae@DN217_c0_g1_i1.p1